MLLAPLAVLFSALAIQVSASSQDESTSQLHAKRGPGGWNSVKYPNGTVQSSIPVQNGNLELFAMTKKGLDKTKLKRIVFVVHGEGRNPWDYYTTMTHALEKANSTGVIKNMDEIGIWAPGYWCEADEGVWPASELAARSSKKTVHQTSSKQMVWTDDDWSYGSNSIYPASNNNISAFTTLDDTISYFGNRSIFPKVNTIVLAGHSMGGQMLHRYAQLGNPPTVEAEVQYYIANPASYLYMDERRPNKGIGGATSRAHCPNYNNYKYGLNEINTKLSYNSPHLSSIAMWTRFKQRFVHYQLGLNDHASATKSCGAYVQGSSHLNRGRIYQAYLQMLGYPKRHTIDYIVGVGHNDAQMFRSHHGMFRLFVQNYAQGKTEPSTNDVTHGLNVTFTGYTKNGASDMPTRRSRLHKLT